MATACVGLLSLALLADERVPVGSSASRIHGVVRDSSGGVIRGATVSLITAYSREVLITDSEGTFDFLLTAVGPLRIEVSAGGFTPWERSYALSEASALEIVLQPAQATKFVTVTATRTAQRVDETASSVTVLTDRDLATSASLPLDAKLREVPGFALFRRTDSRVANPTTQGVSLRGTGASGASRALVLADAIPLNDPFGGWIYWDRIPATKIDSVEILRGGASDLYGTGALGGVINIVPRRPLEDSLQFETMYGNENSFDSSFSGSIRAGKWIADVSGEFFRTNGYIPVSTSDRGSVDSLANSRHTTADLRAERLVSEQLRIFLDASLLGETRDNGTPLQTNRTHFREMAAGGDWQSAAVGTVTIRAYGGPQNYDQSFSAIALDRDSESLTRLQRVPAQQAGALAQWSRPFGTREMLSAGFEYRQVQGASDEIGFTSGLAAIATGSGGRQRATGFFAESITRPTPRWMIQASIREDGWINERGYLNRLPLSGGAFQNVSYADRRENAWSPRLSVLRRLNERVAVSASIYRAFRAPTLNELYRSFRVGNVVTQANAELHPERLTGGEAGVSIRTLNDRLTARTSIFWADISSPVANVTLSALPNLITRQRQNLGSTRSRGVEFELEERVSNSVGVSAAYQFADARVARFPADATIEGLLIPHVPRHALTFQARYASARWMTAAVQARYAGAEYDDDQNQLHLNSYCELNAVVSRQLKHEVELFSAAENLLDTRYDVARTPVRNIGPPVLVRAGIRISLR